MNKYAFTRTTLSLLGAAACQNRAETALPSQPPTQVDELVDRGFQHAGAVEASPDGQTFYVAAYTEGGAPAVFAADAASGALTVLAEGAPLAYPSDLAASCDGRELFITDMGMAAATEPVDHVDAIAFDDQPKPSVRPQATPIHRMDVASGLLTPLAPARLARAAGVIVSIDCEMLYVSGWTTEGLPTVMRTPVDGGAATPLHQGAPLVSPTGIHVDADDVTWVMDHGAVGKHGQGVLFAITPTGDVSEVASGIQMGRHGGVSLTPGGVTAVIPALDELGQGQLITANTKTGEFNTILTPEILAPTGVAAARQAPVMVIAGEDTLHIATFAD